MSGTVALLGFPLKHSISPLFQQAAFDFYKLDLRYQAWETAPERLTEAVAKLRQTESIGANVTVPHKEAVIPLLDRIEGDAGGIGAVNTIVKQGEQLIGHNTDCLGFMRGLQEAGFEPPGNSVLLLGAGGAARAVAYGLLRAGVKSLTIANRSQQRAWKLAQDLFGLVTPQQELTAISWDGRREAVYGCSLLVNATSMGMKHSPQENLSPFAADDLPWNILVYDLVYNPPLTPLLQEAQKSRCRIQGGLAMLVYQGGYSFELWTGVEAPIDAMFQAAREALRG